jgi:peptidoglycan/xylan/chitin deacetylase (PgdA/CDA1 family)
MPGRKQDGTASVTDALVVRGLTGSRDSRLAELLGDGLAPVAPLSGAVGCLRPVVADLSGPDADLAVAGEGLPAGVARPEALAVRLRERGFDLEQGDPLVIPDVRTLLDRCWERGCSSVDLIEADSTLLSGMQIGAWFDARWRTRALRRLARGGTRRLLRPLALSSPRWLAALGDLAFWAGVRSRADRRAWRRLTSRSYVALVYHRFAGELKPGQERIDIAPRRFARQLRALRLAGFRPVSAEDVVAFHAGGRKELPRRSLVITVDDGLADCLEPLRRHADWAPQLFVPTRELGGKAHWIDGEPVATWDGIRDLESAGARIGSHCRHHRRLGPLGAGDRKEELAGSLHDLRERLVDPLPMVAFPNGDHDAALCAEARAVGYSAAFTTQKGRNGAGTDVHCLKRVSVHGRDGALAILWKAVTGEGLPAAWLRLRERGRAPQAPS